MQRGAPGWLSPSASALGSGLDPRVLGWSPAQGSLVGRKAASSSPIHSACIPSLTVILCDK